MRRRRNLLPFILIAIAIFLFLFRRRSGQSGQPGQSGQSDSGTPPLVTKLPPYPTPSNLPPSIKLNVPSPRT